VTRSERAAHPHPAAFGGDGTSFRLYYDGRFGDTVEQHAAGIKGTLPV
jgi:hypothetical protein